MKTILTICMIFSFGVSQAQDVFQESLYSAETVMKNRDKIALTDQQAEKIKKIHSQNAGEFSTIKWDLDAATAKLKTLLDEPKINQEAVQKQMDLVLQLENQLKKKQLTSLVAIKNELTESQQIALTSLKKAWTVNDGEVYRVVPGLASSSPSPSSKVRISSGPATSGNYLSNKPSGSISNVSPSGDITILPNEKSKLYIQVDQKNIGSMPIFYLKTKAGLQEVKSLESINPDDIESIEVLKNESAITRFGEAGKNGVIIVTLKKK
jgi:hypothetical protein